MPTPNPIAAAAVAPVADRLVVTTATAATRPTWYAVNRKDATNEAEITIYDEIGAWGIRAEDFIAELKKITAKTINLRLNTPGGEVFDATAIYNALCEHPAEIIVHIDGVAASAGSYIAMSGDEVRMADNAYLMIHNARGGVMGEAEEMRKYAEVLEMMNDNIAGIYERKAGKDRGHWHNLMDAETWFTAEEAKAEGLIDVVYTASDEKPSRSAKAKFDTSIYNKIPDPVKKMWGIQQVTAPETDATGSLPDAPPTAVPIKENTMADAIVTQSTPAQTPAAGDTVPQGNSPNPTPPAAPVSRTQELDNLRNASEQARAERDRKQGAETATAAITKRLREIVAACPGNPQMAIDAFLNGQTPEAVKLAYEAAERVRIEANARAEESASEIARLKMMIEIGGHAGIDMDLATSIDDDGTAQVDPKIRAEQEWDQKPGVRKGWSTKARYVAVRVAELRGNLRSAPVATRAR